MPVRSLWQELPKVTPKELAAAQDSPRFQARLQLTRLASAEKHDARNSSGQKELSERLALEKRQIRSFLATHSSPSTDTTDGRRNDGSTRASDAVGRTGRALRAEIAATEHIITGIV